MSSETKKIVLPPFLMRRFEAFRIAGQDGHSYVVRDKLQGKTHDFDAWQFYILETLPAYDSFERLQTAFQDRFDRPLSRQDLAEFLASVADRKLFDETAAQHPLLAPYMQVTYKVEDGKAVPNPFEPVVPAAAPAASPPGPPAAPAKAAAQPAADAALPELPEDTVLPAGVQDALGMDWRTTRAMVGFVDPRPLLRLIVPLLRPLRHLVYAVPILLLAALLLLYNYSGAAAEDLGKLKLDVTLAEHLLYLFVTVHVVVTLTVSCVAHHFKVSVEKVGVALVFGFMPRWAVKMTGAERMTRPQAMWLHGSALLARVVLFALGALVWFNTRDGGGELPQFALLLVFGTAAGFLLEAGNPLVKAHGYFLLAAFLNEPHLRGKAYAALFNKIRGTVYRAADSRLLLLYALVSSTYVLLIVLFIGWMVARFVIGDLELGGSALLITFGFVGYLLWRNYAGLKKFGETYDRQLQFDRWRSRTLYTEGAETDIKPVRRNYWPTALLICILLALFIPYPYEPGGSFLVYPVRRQVLSTDVPGLIEAVHFDGGESVRQGTVLASLAHDDYKAEIKVLLARIEEQKAVIRNLETLPRPEEVKLAEEQLAVQQAREQFSREKVPRLEKLFKAGVVTFEELDSARKDHLTDVNQVSQKQAELALVKVPVTESQISAARAKLAALQEELAGFASKVRRTSLKMPFDGNILTLHLRDKTNSFLDKGAPFAVLEYTGTVTAEIDVPEADMQFVRLGTAVRLRAVSYSLDREFEGKVTLIDRNVTVKTTGNVIKVIATIENKDGLLKTGMTGRAKLAGETMPVWKAFTLSLTRFFQVHVWSWIP